MLAPPSIVEVNVVIYMHPTLQVLYLFYPLEIVILKYWVGQKVRSGFFRKMLQKNLKELFGQPDIKESWLSWVHCCHILSVHRGRNMDVM